VIHPAPDGGQALHENDGRGPVMVPASGPAGYRQSPRACRGDGADQTAASNLARHAGNPGHGPVRHEEFGDIATATAAEQAWRAGKWDKDLHPAGSHTGRPAPAHPMRAGPWGRTSPPTWRCDTGCPTGDVTGRACANANETLAGVPQLRCGKCPRIRGLSWETALSLVTGRVTRLQRPAWSDACRQLRPIRRHRVRRALPER